MFFCVLAAAFVMRPMREAAGISGGVEQLPMLFLGTMLAMLLVNPLFALLVAAMPRVRFIPLVYLFFLANTLVLALLFALVREDGTRQALGRVFYVWMSVFNLFSVSVFWILMVDVWGPDRGSRLFGFIGVGGTIGAIAGAALTHLTISALPQWAMFVLAGVLLEVGRHCSIVILRLSGVSGARASGVLCAGPEPSRRTIEGVWLLVRSPYLLGIAGYVLAFTFLSTIAYFLQGAIVEAQFATREERTEFFALIDVSAQSVTLLTQIFLTGRLIRGIGVAWTLALLPLLTLAGFAALGVVMRASGEAALASAGVLWVFFAFQVLRRGLNYALAKPSRELLFTACTQEEKYGAKPVIDTFVYRTGDAIGALAYPALTQGTSGGLVLGGLGLGVGAVAMGMTPLAALWCLLALVLGIAHRRRLLRQCVAGTVDDSAAQRAHHDSG